MRTREDCTDGVTNASVEASVHIACFVEGHQRIQIFVRHRPPERAPREVAEDLARTGRFIGRFRGLTDKDLLATGRLAQAGYGERPANLQGMHRLYALLPAFQRYGASAL